MKVVGIITNTVLAALFTTGIILMGPSTTLMAASHKDQHDWNHYQTRHYKGGSKTEWHLGKVTDPSTGKEYKLLKMEYYDEKGNLEQVGIVSANPDPRDGDSDPTEWPAWLKLLMQKRG